MKRKKWLLLGFAAAMILSLAGILSYYWELAKEQQRSEEVLAYTQMYEESLEQESLQDQVGSEEEIVSDADIDQELSQEQEQVISDLYIDFSSLSILNEDICGWITWDEMDIYYPLLQGTDNDYYLKHSLDRAKSRFGCIMLDYENDRDMKDYNTYIYGHNTANGSMFGGLKKLLTQEGQEYAGEIVLYSQEKRYVYQVVAAYVAAYDSDRFRLVESEEEMQQYWAEAVELSQDKENSKVFLLDSWKDKEHTLAENTRILTLVTCYGASGTTKRLVVHAILLEEEKIIYVN